MIPKLPQQIKESVFVIIATCDGYSTEIVSGPNLFSKMMEFTMGYQWKETVHPEEQGAHKIHLYNPDAWSIDNDKWNSWSEDFEDGSIQIYRLTI